MLLNKPVLGLNAPVLNMCHKEFCHRSISLLSGFVFQNPVLCRVTVLIFVGKE